MEQYNTSRILVPSRETRKDKLLAWCRESWQQGDAHLRSQRPYKDIIAAMRMLAGDEGPVELPPEVSHVYTNRLKRQIREVVAVISQINPSWSYNSLNPDFKDVADTLNRLLLGWWTAAAADLKLRKGNQYAAGVGTGWIQPTWRKARGRYGKGEIDLDVHGPNSVRLVQPSADMDHQKAYAVILTVEKSIAAARQIFPEHADKMVPDRDAANYGGQSRVMKLIEKLGGSLGGSYVMKRFGAQKPMEQRMGSYPTVDLNYMWIQDNSVNPGSTQIEMGKVGTSWHYKVPYVGQQIEVGTDAAGRPIYRTADYEDAMLYPMRRLIVFTNTWILYDGPSPNWHGKVPLIKLVVDDWPWEFLGYGMLRDGEPLQKEINATLRGIGDRIQNALRPALAYDENIVSKGTMDKFDPRKPGARIQMNKQMGGTGIESILPPELLRVYPEHMQYVEMLAEFMDHQMAVTDMRNLAKARQIPSDKTIDKMLEVAGPLVMDMTRVLEVSIRDLGQMVGAMFFQHYDSRRRVAMIGQDGLKLDKFDFDPQTLWPVDEQIKLLQMASVDRNQRLREFIENFQLNVVPHSLHEITQTQHKLMLFQLWRDPTFPLDPKTLAEAFNLRNFGGPEDDGESTIYDRWKRFMADQAEFQSVLSTLAQMGQMAALASGGGGQPQPVGGQQNNNANGSAAGQGSPGRKPSGQESPKLESKDGGMRQTVTES